MIENITKQLLDFYYSSYVDFNDSLEITKYEYIANVVFDLHAYDGDVEDKWGKAICEVLEIIIERKNFEYIKDSKNYDKFLLVCQLLDKKKWIEWGTSIRGSWICSDKYSDKMMPCIEYVDVNDERFDEEGVEFKEDNLAVLIEWAKE